MIVPLLVLSIKLYLIGHVSFRNFGAVQARLYKFALRTVRSLLHDTRENFVRM